MCGYYPPNTWLYFRTTTWPNVWSECPSGPCLDDGITQQQCPVGTKGLKVWSSVAVANLLRHFMCCAFRSALLHSLVVIGGYLSYYCLPISLSFISSTKWTWLFGKMLADQQFLKYWNKAASLTPTTIPHFKITFFLFVILALNFSRSSDICVEEQLKWERYMTKWLCLDNFTPLHYSVNYILQCLRFQYSLRGSPVTTVIGAILLDQCC